MIDKGDPRKPTTHTKVDLAEADEALSHLLENLLSEVPQESPKEPEPPVEVLNKTPEPPIQTEEPVVEPEVVEEVEAQTPKKPSPPEWTAEAFKALIFSLGGNRYAVPLIDLDSIMPATDLTPMPAQPAWHMGVTPYRDGKMVAVDMGILLNLKPLNETPKYFLVIGEGAWGLACDSLETPITVMPEDIKFRQSGDSVNWIIGVMPQQMCPLLDVKTIEKIIRHE